MTLSKANGLKTRTKKGNDMKTLATVATMLILGTSVALAGQAGDVIIIGETQDNINAAIDSSNEAVQQVQGVKVRGTNAKAGDIGIAGSTQGNLNIAGGVNNVASQQVQGVRVDGDNAQLGNAGIVGITGNNVNMAAGVNNVAEQQVQGIDVADQ